MNSDKYIKLVKENVILFIRDKYNNLYLFQENNTPICVSHKTKTFMFEAGIAVMKWQVYILDLNPVVNTQSYRSCKVYQHGK